MVLLKLVFTLSRVLFALSFSHEVTGNVQAILNKVYYILGKKLHHTVELSLTKNMGDKFGEAT